ncbi:MAG: T9SS type A sorting domain-containing protein [Bacteroidetes bacterium]|nr:T9SS type A sorting domain-containing protein [Bacteroidota bacterium]
MKPLFTCLLFTIVSISTRAQYFLDTTFNKTGINEVPSNSIWIHRMRYSAIQAEGKVLTLNSQDGSPVGSKWELTRFKKDGTLDSSFGANGAVIVSPVPTYPFFCSGLKLASNGDIYIYGTVGISVTEKRGYVISLKPTGVSNTSFAGGSKLINFGYLPWLSSLDFQTDGKIIIQGTYYDGSVNVLASARLKTDGSLDATYGAGGIFKSSFAPLSGIDPGVNSMKLLDNDKMLIAGAYINTGIANYKKMLYLVRCKQNGTPDSSFGVNGLKEIDTINLYVRQLLIKGNNVYVCVSQGATPTTFIDSLQPAVYKFDTSGNRQLSYGVGGQGRFLCDSPFVERYNIAAIGFTTEATYCLQKDERIVISGTADTGANTHFKVVRYTPNGILDLTFGTNGAFNIRRNRTEYCMTSSIYDDGRIIVAGMHRTGTMPDTINVVCMRITSKQINIYLGIAEPQKEKASFTLYPNPSANGDVHINYTNAAVNGITTLMLYDIQGRLIQTQTVLLTSPNGTIEYQQPELPVGTYMLQVYNGNTKQSVQMVVSR